MTSLPPHYGLNLTPTYHSQIPSNIDPSNVTLPHPFVVVITGAGKGLGYHMALAYAKAGASGIVIASRTMGDLDKLEGEINGIARKKVGDGEGVGDGNGVEVLKCVTDVQSEDSVVELEKNVRQKFGRCDVVIANAGIISKYIDNRSSTSNDTPQSNLPVGLITDNDWSRVLDINLNGTWRIAKAFLPLLGETDGAKTLIASTSMAAHNSASDFCPVAYNTSKLAVCRLMEHIHHDHGPGSSNTSSASPKGIRAYALHPGAVVTPQTVGHEGEAWGQVLTDDIGLAGAFCVWLSRDVKSKEWLSGRFVSCNWDVGELMGMKGKLEGGDMLRFRMVVPGG